MFRFLVRVVGLLVLAAGFASLVIDGTKSIAGSELSLTPFSALLGARVPSLQQAVVRNIHPLLWDPVMTTFLRLPVWLVLAATGLMLLRLARRKAPAVGYSTRG
jgi:hypothetical protein